jgi:hypothetical protein
MLAEQDAGGSDGHHGLSPCGTDDPLITVDKAQLGPLLCALLV